MEMCRLCGNHPEKEERIDEGDIWFYVYYCETHDKYYTSPEQTEREIQEKLRESGMLTVK